MARFRTEVRMNLAMSSAWFGDVHHFDDIDVLPFPREGQVPVHGDRRQDDFICGPAWNRPIAAAIPSARYVEVADTGHLPQYEQPGAFRAALLDWLPAT
jgi:pimeloyl-ACP methyl ester carboxylesterase